MALLTGGLLAAARAAQGTPWVEYVTTIISAIVAIGSLLWAMRRDKTKAKHDEHVETVDYVRTQLEGFTELVTTLQAEVGRLHAQRTDAERASRDREESLIREVQRLRLEVTALREQLVLHGVPIPVMQD